MTSKDKLIEYIRGITVVIQSHARRFQAELHIHVLEAADDDELEIIKESIKDRIDKFHGGDNTRYLQSILSNLEIDPNSIDFNEYLEIFNEFLN